MNIRQLVNYALILSMISLMGCAPPNTKPEPDPITNKSEPVKPEPVKPEPVKPEPVKPEPVKPEPVKPEPVKPEPVKPEPVKPEPVKPEPVKPEPVKPEPVKPEPVKPEPVKPEPVKPEPKPASMYTLTGKINLNQDQLDRQDADISHVIVYFEPENTENLNLTPSKKAITTQNKRFEPNVLAVTVGSEISFPNMDRILHNVFSVSPNSEFDLGLYSAGTSKSVTFDQPGIIYVHCNVHHSMQADILVLDTPYFTQVDDSGHFELKGISDPSGQLKIWHPRGNIKEMALSQNSEHQDIEQTIIITRPKVPKHTNKFGQSYRPTRD